jgi:ribonuclease HII
MELLGGRHPLYAWESNKGYATPDHLAALAAFGFTSHHRKSFAPVVQLELMPSPVSSPSESRPTAAY